MADGDCAAGLTPALIRLGMAHRRLAAELLAAHGLHPGQERLVLALVTGPRALGELADALGVNAPTITKMVARMERAGLVATCGSPADRRVKLASLTDRGREAADGAREAYAQLDAVTTGVLDEGEQATLTTLLGRWADAVEAAQVGGDDPPTC